MVETKLILNHKRIFPKVKAINAVILIKELMDRRRRFQIPRCPRRTGEDRPSDRGTGTGFVRVIYDLRGDRGGEARFKVTFGELIDVTVVTRTAAAARIQRGTPKYFACTLLSRGRQQKAVTRSRRCENV